MGTRHLTVVQLDGTHRIAQYGQWDGYPSGQGTTVLDFLRGMDRPTFEQKLRAARFGTEEEIRQTWTQCGANPNSDMVSFDISKKHGNRYPALSRNTGAKVLRLVQDSPPGILLNDSIEFAGDGLFCEWAYVIDLDNNALEVYEGFNEGQMPVGQRFSHLAREGEYTPVVLKATFPLSSLPDDEAFVKQLEHSDEEEDAAA